MTPSIDDIQAWGESLEGSPPQAVLAAAITRYRPRIVLACGFGAEDVVLVDMMHRIAPSMALFYLDTDFLFPETYATRDRIIERYELKPAQVHQVKSLLTPEQQAEQHGEALARRVPDRARAVAGKGRAVVARGRTVGVEDLRKAVRPRVLQ